MVKTHTKQIQALFLLSKKLLKTGLPFQHQNAPPHRCAVTNPILTRFLFSPLSRLEEMKAARAQDRETIDKQNQQLSDYEAEINLLRRRIEALEQERERDKKEIARLTDALNRARIVSLLPSSLSFIHKQMTKCIVSSVRIQVRWIKFRKCQRTARTSPPVNTDRAAGAISSLHLAIIRLVIVGTKKSTCPASWSIFAR